MPNITPGSVATPASAKKPNTPPHSVPNETAAALALMREGMSQSKLGHLGRRIESLVRDAQESIDTYGSKVIVAKLGEKEISLPVGTTITIAARIACGGAVQEYTYAVGAPIAPNTSTVRLEAKIDSFVPNIATTVA